MMEEKISIKLSKEKIKCLNCKYGLIISPYMNKCIKYKEGKPDEVYFEGKDCPYFEQAILRKENN